MNDDDKELDDKEAGVDEFNPDALPEGMILDDDLGLEDPEDNFS